MQKEKKKRNHENKFKNIKHIPVNKWDPTGQFVKTATDIN